MRRVPQRPSKKVSSVIRFPLRSARDTRPSIVAVAPSQSAILRASPGGGWSTSSGRHAINQPRGGKFAWCMWEGYTTAHGTRATWQVRLLDHAAAPLSTFIHKSRSGEVP